MRAGLTQRKVAEKLNCSRGKVSWTAYKFKFKSSNKGFIRSKAKDIHHRFLLALAVSRVAFFPQVSHTLKSDRRKLRQRALDLDIHIKLANDEEINGTWVSRIPSPKERQLV